MDLASFLLPGRTSVETAPFNFHCHSGVSCYLKCCRDVDLLLYPYDIIQLKQALKIHSSDFLHKYTQLCEGNHAYFPGLKLKLEDDADKSCPFLSDSGCTVYKNRPSACRTYPLERGIECIGHGSSYKIHYFMTHHPYCKGHFEDKIYTIAQWERDQFLYEYNYFNELWAQIDAYFSGNPWAGEGKAGPYQQLAFMVCYNIDGFRSYVEQHQILLESHLNKSDRKKIERDDGQLLKFGFTWLKQILQSRQLINI